MAKYNITRIVPEGFIHTQGFNEVIDSLAWSLSALGHDTNVTQNWLSEHGETNIIFGAEVMAPFQRLPPNSILFNLEQPSHPNMEKVRQFAKGIKVWDFSRRNVDEWLQRGYDAVHVPIGYTPNLTRIPKAEVQDIDVLFYGWLTPRRTAIIDQLRAAGLKVYASAACYGGGRDNLISRAKVCLNVHHDGRDMFEIVRVSYLMANASLVVTEDSVDDDDYQLNGLWKVPYRALVDACMTRVSIEDVGAANEALRVTALNAIRKHDFTATVARALEGGITSVSPTMKRQQLEWCETDPVRQRYGLGCLRGDMKDFLPWLRSHAKGNIVEIGVRDGASTSAFLLGIEGKGGHLYSIDAQDCSHLFPNHPQWTFIHANSTDFQAVIKRIPYEIDLLLIDGDHSRAGVLSDFTYARQLRPGGCVLFHDISPEDKPSDCSDMSWPGDDVKNVFEELSAALVPQGWKSEKLLGKFGMGVLYKPALVTA